MTDLLERISNREPLLSEDDFFSHFHKAWGRMRQRFFKFESLQSYDEGDESGYLDFQNSDYEAFVKKVRKSRSQEKEMYESARARGTSFFRLREACFPLSKYLEFEFYTYFISQTMGEKIRFLESGELRKQIGGGLQDIVIFDDFALLIYQYEGTELKGGYCVYDQKEVKAMASLMEALFASGCPFEEMMAANPNLVSALVQRE